MDSPVEVTTKYATTVPDLTTAWTFVMEHIDQVGPDPRITISPIWQDSLTMIDCEPREVLNSHRLFEVVVSGMVHEENTDG